MISGPFIPAGALGFIGALGEGRYCGVWNASALDAGMATREPAILAAPAMSMERRDLITINSLQGLTFKTNEHPTP
jgi:hypothetical protein